MVQLLSAALLVMGQVAIISAQTDFSITNTHITSEWNQTDWSLTTPDYVPGLYQSRMSLANGYVCHKTIKLYVSHITRKTGTDIN